MLPNPLTQEELVLIVLASVPAGFFGPFNVQKSVFLVSEKLPNLCDQPFTFESSFLGPRTNAIISALSGLVDKKLVRVVNEQSKMSREYVASIEGIEHAKRMSSHLTEHQLTVIGDISKTIMKMSIPQMIEHVIKDYPELFTRIPY